MNCNEIKEKMWNYLFNDQKPPQEFEQHLAQCSDCNAEFEHLQQVIQNMKPKTKVCASDNFTKNIIKKLNKEDQKMKKRIPFYMKVAAIILLLITPLSILFLNGDFNYQASASPANRIFSESLKEMLKSKSMRMELEIRTLEGENMEYIGTEYDFVRHLIKVEFSPKKWTIEKPGRTVLFDGKNQYLGTPNVYAIKGDAKAGFVNWLHILLTPDKILEIEKQRSKKEGAYYTIEETENQLILTTFASAQGNYTNDYLKNTSVTESDNKRIFRFDKETYQLLAFELYIIGNQEEILVMKTTEIKYNEVFSPKEFDVKIFGSAEITIAEKLDPKVDKNLQTKTPEEIAFYFFDACAKKDWKKAKKVNTYPAPLFLLLKSYLGGLEIIEIGDSFQSGTSVGFFVPYTVKLKSGEIKEGNLALRNDNPQKMWIVDGGI
jgi:hypothetical protein